jgi:signal recognition particle subunit SRP54
VFSELSKKLASVFGGLRSRGILTPEVIDNVIRGIRVSMLDADVALPVVREVTNLLREKLNGQEVIKSTSPEQTINKHLYDEIVRLLGIHDPGEGVKNGTMLMCGLQGSGKTTTSAKLANLFAKKHSKSTLLVSLDTTRAAAVDQLRMLASANNLCFFDDFKEADGPITIAKKAMKVSSKFDITIFDTAGRMYVNDSLMEELIAVRDVVKPRETFLVIDSMMGQDALKSAISFNDNVNLTGLIMTRIDGDNRGGACLSARSVTNCQIRYICTGEKVNDIEAFLPERVASRILGNGDIVSFVEKMAEQNANIEISNSKDFDMDGMEKHLQQIRKMGGISGFLKYIPGLGKIKEKLSDANIDERIIDRQVAIIKSMTKKERRNPTILNASRRRRIAAGAGMQVSDVNRLIKQYDTLKEMMKKMEKASGSKNGDKNLQATFERLFR